MVDNFNLIQNMLRFDSPSDFYFIQVIQRKKEVSEIGRNNRLVKSYSVFSLDKYLLYQNEIKTLCNVFSARAYIHLNRRNIRNVALDSLVEMSRWIQCEQYGSISKVYNTCCGRANSIDKSWVVDIDSTDFGVVEKIKMAIALIQPEGEKTILIVPTKNGCHLITKPFNVQEFKKIERYKDIDIHKNNPTVLYSL